MGDLSNNFSRYEFRCECGCGRDTVDAELLGKLEEIREHFDRPVSINSAHRCADHNEAVGGSSGSQHLYGRAVDIVVEGTPPDLVAEFADQIGMGGIGRYDTFTHIDTRPGRSRWHG